MLFDKELLDKLSNIHTTDCDRADKRNELNIRASTWRDDHERLRFL